MVVIGILIALAINNWREAKKARDFEVKMLSEIQTTLEADLFFLDTHLLGTRNQREVDAVSFFKDLLAGNPRNLDSLRYNYFGLTNGQFFRINTGPYESLKSIGLEKISNDSLRNKIVYFYGFIFPRNRDLIQYQQDQVDDDVELLRTLEEDMTYNIQNDEVEIIRPTPPVSIIKDPTFLRVLKNTERRTEWTIAQSDIIRDELISLKDFIQQELDK